MNIWLSLMQTVSRSLQTGPVFDKALDLQPGEVVYGTLLEMFDGETAVFEIKGKPVRAQTEVQMPAGSRIPLLVVGIRESGQLELKVLPEETLRAAGQSFVKAEQSAANLVQPTANSEKSAANSGRTAVNPVLPEPDVTPEINKAQPPQIPQKIEPIIERLLVNLGLQPSLLLKTVAQSLLQAKVSIQPAMLLAIEAIVNQELNDYKAHMTLQNREPAPAELQRITNMSVEILTGMAQKKIPLMPAAFAAMKALWNGPSLQQVLDNHDLPVPLRSELLSTFSFDLSQLDNLSAVERGQLLTSAASRMGLDHEPQLTLSMLAQPQQPAELADTLKSRLLKEELLQPSSQAVEQALNHVVGQQLMHSPRDEQSPFLYQYISLPMFVDKQPANADIHVLSRKRGSRQLDPDNCYLYFQLCMPSLGDIGLHVQVVERLVALRLVVEQDSHLTLDESDLLVLKTGLEQAGYQLGTVRKETGSPVVKDPFAQLPITVSAAGVDYRI